MKRFPFVLFILALILLGVTAQAAGPWYASAVLTQATDNQATAAVTMPGTGVSLGGPIKTLWVKVPTITSSTVYVQCAGPDNTADFKDFYGFSNGTNMVLGSTAGGTGGVTFQVPGDVSACSKIKVKCGTAQAANRTFVLYGR